MSTSTNTNTKSAPVGVPIGIDALSYAVPRSYLALADLAAARGVDPAKYLHGLGTSEMAVPGPDEDSVTLAADAARRLFAKCGRPVSEIGLCVVGTETAIDHAKPIAAHVHGLIGLPSSCRTFETKHACFGGTAGILHAVDWIASGAARGRSALVICSDIARYPLGTPGEPTQGAGAVALLISERPRLIELKPGESGSFSKDVYDFWRPLERTEALTDGHYSVQCYLDALTGAYKEYRAHCPDELVRTVYHVPYGKMARKAHRARRMIDGLDEAASDATFAQEVESSLRLPARVGNLYTGSMYLALASLLQFESQAIAGKRIGFFSYGSGCTAEFFAGRVVADAPSMVQRLGFLEPLEARVKIDVAHYERIRRGEIGIDALAPAERAAGVRFLGIDGSHRRQYAVPTA